MGKGIFLAAPNLNADDIDVTATSELGPRAGQPIPFEGNSNLLNMTAIGDAGDALAHDVEILGTQDRPAYSPLTEDGARQFTAPETFATLGGTIAAGADALLALVAAADRLYAIVVDGTALKVYLWNGTVFTLKATLSSLEDASGGLSAVAVDANIYIAIGNNTSEQVELYRFNTQTNTIGTLAEVFVSPSDPDGDAVDFESLALGTNGGLLVLLVTRIVGSGPARDVDVYFGSVGTMTKRDESINATFGEDWTSGDDIRAAAITYNRTDGFVAGFRTGAGDLKLLTSTDGDAWEEFVKLGGNPNKASHIRQPAATTPWADALTCAIAIENRRVFTWRATAALEDGAPTAIAQQWFDGDKTWSAEIAAQGAVTIDAGTQLAAVNWRGTMYYGWRSSDTLITIRKCNELTETDTGYFREIRFNEQMFVAGLDDDSQTALFFVANGSIREGDKFRIPATEYDYKVEHILNDFMVQVWRGEHNAEQIIQFDKGSGRAFVLDAITLFRTNFPTIRVLLDDDVDFGDPSTDQEISATVKTASTVSSNRNRVLFAVGTFKQRQFAVKTAVYWVKLSTGIFRILDNTDSALIIDGSAGILGVETATIFRDAMGYVFETAPTPRRYLRLVTPVLEVPDGYYQISRAIFDLRLELPRNFSNGFTREDVPIESRTDLKSGARFPTRLNLYQRVAFNLPFQVLQLDKHLTPIRGFHGLSQGGQQLVAFWPFPTGAHGYGDQPDVEIGRFTEPLSVQHINQLWYEIGGAQFETEVE